MRLKVIKIIRRGKIMTGGKTVTLFIIGFMFVALIAFAVWSVIGYVALHIIGKFW